MGGPLQAASGAGATGAEAAENSDRNAETGAGSEQPGKDNQLESRFKDWWHTHGGPLPQNPSFLPGATEGSPAAMEGVKTED
eukprot:12277862-Alexandrium_andersonii.AAC.1